LKRNLVEKIVCSQQLINQIMDAIRSSWQKTITLNKDATSPMGALSMGDILFTPQQLSKS
jgi:hypothetical protein